MSATPPSDGPRKAVEVLAILRRMTLAERKRLFKALEYESSPAHEAGFVVIPNQVFDLVEKQLLKSLKWEQGLIELLGKFGRHIVNRNRRSDPETIRRNVEICDRRKLDKKVWTLGKLAKTYDVTKRAISLVLAEEEKWRRLAAKLPPE